MNAGFYPVAEVQANATAEDKADFRVFVLQERPDAGWYIGGSALGAQKWAISQGGTAEYLGILGRVLSGERITESGEYVHG